MAAIETLDVVGVGIPVEEGHSSGRFDDTYNWDLDIHKVDASAVEPPPQVARKRWGFPPPCSRRGRLPILSVSTGLIRR